MKRRLPPLALPAARVIPPLLVALTLSALLWGCDSDPNGRDDSIRPFVFSRSVYLVNGRPASTPDSGVAWRFLHVLPGGSAGDGSFETPFNSIDAALVEADAGSVIYIHPSPDASFPGFTIPDGVLVLSSGPRQFLPTKRGPQLLPSSGSGITPTITGTVTIGNNTVLSGFNIRTTSGPGVQGTGIDNVILSRLDIDSPGEEGIKLTSVHGTVDITDNQVSNTGDGPYDGILLANDDGTVEATFQRNTVTHTSGSGINIVSTNVAKTTALVADNIIDQTFFSAIKYFNRDKSVVEATVLRNRTSGNTRAVSQDAGIRIGVFEESVVTALVDGNVITDNTSNGIFMGTELEARMEATISNNVVARNIGNGIFYGSQENSEVAGLIQANTVTGSQMDPEFPFPPNAPTGNGIFTGSRDDAFAEVSLEQNNANANMVSGIYFFVGNRSLSDMNIDGNQALGNGASGIELVVGISSPGAGGGPPGPSPAPGTLQGTALVFNNTVSGNAGFGPTPEQGGGGITVRALTAARFDVDVRGNNVTDNANHPNALAGIALQAVAVAQLRVGVRYNNISGGEAPQSLMAQSVGAVPGGVCLDLQNNLADKPYILLRAPETDFQAAFANNAGPVVQPAVPVAPLGDCVVPDLSR